MRSAFAETAPFRPSGTFPRCAEEGRVAGRKGKFVGGRLAKRFRLEPFPCVAGEGTPASARRREVFHLEPFPCAAGEGGGSRMGAFLASTFPDNAVHVVAGILSDSQGRILLAERAAGTHLAGAWEFPGGKIEPGESAESALRRELHEELGVDIGAVEPLISIPWRYPQKSIVLHAFRVRDFRGEPHGREQQALRWIAPDEAVDLPMPPPDRPIVTALRLPGYYAITPEPDDDATRFLDDIDRLLAAGIRLIQLRAKRLTADRLLTSRRGRRNSACAQPAEPCCSTVTSPGARTRSRWRASSGGRPHAP